MADFTNSYAHTMGNEGGYVDDPDDAGGETYCGVSRRYHPTWKGWDCIDRVKEGHKNRNDDKSAAMEFELDLRARSDLSELVKEFYKTHFWDRFLGDEISDDAIASELFDTGVNMGVHRAVLFLQQSLNLLNRNGASFSDLVEDGGMGPNTLRALGVYLKNDRREFLLKLQNGMQMHHYIEYCRAKPSQEKYIRGWLKRVSL